MKKKRGKFYSVKNDEFSQGDTTIILCTKSTNNKTFEGVVVKAGNNTFVGKVSKNWTEHIFSIEVENKF